MVVDPIPLFPGKYRDIADSGDENYAVSYGIKKTTLTITGIKLNQEAFRCNAHTSTGGWGYVEFGVDVFSKFLLATQHVGCNRPGNTGSCLADNQSRDLNNDL